MAQSIWRYVCGYVLTFFAHSAFALSLQFALESFAPLSGSLDLFSLDTDLSSSLDFNIT